MKSSLAPGKEEFGVVLVHQQDVPWRPSGKTVGFILIFPPSRKVRPTAVHKQKEMPAVRLITPSTYYVVETYVSSTFRALPFGSSVDYLLFTTIKNQDLVVEQ